jgi:hypothetical protein
MTPILAGKGARDMLVAILTSLASALPMDSHQSIEVIANVGIVGDRYAVGRGFYSGMSEWDAHVTLIQQEPFDLLAAQHGGEPQSQGVAPESRHSGDRLEFADRKAISHR